MQLMSVPVALQSASVSVGAMREPVRFIVTNDDHFKVYVAVERCGLRTAAKAPLGNDHFRRSVHDHGVVENPEIEFLQKQLTHSW